MVIRRNLARIALVWSFNSSKPRNRWSSFLAAAGIGQFTWILDSVSWWNDGYRQPCHIVVHTGHVDGALAFVAVAGAEAPASLEFATSTLL